MKSPVYQDLISGDIYLGLADDLPEADHDLKRRRSTDLRHALHRIGQAKLQGKSETTFKHNSATMAAVHVALRKLGFLPLKHDHQITVVSWSAPQ